MIDPPAKMAAMHAAEQIRPSAQVSEAQLLAGCKRGRAVFKAPRGTAGWLRLSPACPTAPLRRRLARPLHLSSGSGSADRTLCILGQPAPPPIALRWAAKGCLQLMISSKALCDHPQACILELNTAPGCTKNGHNQRFQDTGCVSHRNGYSWLRARRPSPEPGEGA